MLYDPDFIADSLSLDEHWALQNPGLYNVCN